MMSLRLCLSFLCPLLIALVVHYLLLTDVLYITDNYWPTFDKASILEATPEANVSCRKIHKKQYRREGIPMDAEDPVYYSDNIVIFASGGLVDMFRYGRGHRGDRGNIYIYDVAKDIVFPIQHINFDPSSGFLPHGLYYSKVTNRLYVINHFGAPRHSTVEVFNVMTQTNSPYPFLDRVGSIKSDFQFGVINDLVEAGSNELYITEYLNHPVPENGKLGEQTFNDIVQDISNYGRGISPLLYKTGFLYCRIGSYSLDKNANCTRVEGDKKLFMANGITVNRRKGFKTNLLYVVDALTKKIHLYDIPKSIKGVFHPKSIRTQIKWIKSFDVIDALDNINYIESQDILIGGGVPIKYMSVLNMLSPKVKAPGSVVLVDASSGKSRRIIYHDGKKLGGISGCVFATQKNEQVICGSPYSDGLLLCEVD